jgi:hypothetical protein
MATGGHGLPKVSLRPAMPNPSTPCGRASPETALWLFQGWPAHRAGSLRPSFTLLHTPTRASMLFMIMRERYIGSRFTDRHVTRFISDPITLRDKLVKSENVSPLTVYCLLPPVTSPAGASFVGICYFFLYFPYSTFFSFFCYSFFAFGHQP